MHGQLGHKFNDIISVENLLEAWRDFVCGKRGKRDVQEFSLQLMEHIIALHIDLRQHTYQHGLYQAFTINDTKPRQIHKASVRDRLLHHAIYRVLYPFFDRTFIADSYSCRVEKGTHRALEQFRRSAYSVSRNHTRTCWVLKRDVRKFFASIDHGILLRILATYIPDRDILWLLERVIRSFASTAPGKGLPLGNLTSQLFANVYMNVFDQFVKHTLLAHEYIRYADDFVLLSRRRDILEEQRSRLAAFLQNHLRLDIHPQKVFLRTFSSGVDFLGWVHFPDHRVLRTATKWRMMRGLAAPHTPATVESYRGLLSHGNTFRLQEEIRVFSAHDTQ